MRGILVGLVACALSTSLARTEESLESGSVRLLPPTPCEPSSAPCPEVVCPAEAATPAAIPPRLTLRHDFGDGIGYTRGFSYLEGFLPLYQPDDRSLLFGDLRVVNFDTQNRWEVNAGGGYRSYVDPLGAVCGVNTFYDGRHTDHHFFHQVGVGAEALFERWEFRCNGYIIAGTQQKLTGDIVVPAIIGNQLVLDRIRTFEVAMGGLDAEIGMRVPVLSQFDPRVYAGVYHYSAEGMQSANGVRGRLEAWLTDNCSVHFAVQNDGLFDTTVIGGLALHLGARHVRTEPGAGSVEARLGQRVVRDVNVVIAQKNDLTRYHFESVPNDPPLRRNKPPAPPPPSTQGDPPPKCDPPPKGDPPPDCGPPPSFPWHCLPFPGRPGDPATFPGHHFPPGFHHDCFPGRGRYKFLGVDHETSFGRP